MKIPRKVKVGGHWVSVSEPEVVDKDDEDKIGESWIEKCDIRLQKDMVQSKKEEIFWHEILHTIDPNLPEDKVQSLSFSLYQVMVDNDFLK